MPFDRVPGWVTRFEGAHAGTEWRVEEDAAYAASADGTKVRIAVPVPPLDALTLEGLTAHLQQTWDIGVVLVRKGGFGIARLHGSTLVEHKIGRRHVQGRTKAGGWSQHRFANRRDNQATAAFDAAAGHVQLLLVDPGVHLDLMGTGGDRTAVSRVLAHPELRSLATIPHVWLGGVADPSRAVLDAAISDVRSVEVTLTDQPSSR